MAAVNLENSGLEALVTPCVSGAGQGVVYAALRQAARDFCRDTGCWREKVTEDDGVESVADETDYSLASLTGDYAAEVYRVLWVKLEDTQQHPARWRLVRPATLRFEVAPTAGQTLTAEGVLLPAVGWSSLPEDLVTAWGDAFAAGARALLHGQPGRPWSDPGAARDQWQLREGLAGKARSLVLTERKARPLRARMRVL